MVSDIQLAGYTLTAEEWGALDAETRDELLGAVGGTVELYSPDEDSVGPAILV